MMNLLTVFFIIGGLLLLWLNVRDWSSSQVIISEDEHVAVAEPSNWDALAAGQPSAGHPPSHRASAWRVADRSKKRARYRASSGPKRRLNAVVG
jgi:hypothetical protein